MPVGGDGVHIPFAQEDVINPLDFHHAEVLRLEQHPVADFNGANIRTDGHDSRPIQPAADLGRRWNDDAATGSTFPFVRTLPGQDAIVQQLDRDRTVSIWPHIRKGRCHELPPPGTNDLDENDAGDHRACDRNAIWPKATVVIVKPADDGSSGASGERTRSNLRFQIRHARHEFLAGHAELDLKVNQGWLRGCRRRRHSPSLRGQCPGIESEGKFQTMGGHQGLIQQDVPGRPVGDDDAFGQHEGARTQFKGIGQIVRDHEDGDVQ